MLTRYGWLRRQNAEVQLQNRKTAARIARKKAAKLQAARSLSRRISVSRTAKWRARMDRHSTIALAITPRSAVSVPQVEALTVSQETAGAEAVGGAAGGAGAPSGHDVPADHNPAGQAAG